MVDPMTSPARLTLFRSTTLAAGASDPLSMLTLPLLVAGVSALNCSTFDLQSFDTVHVVSELLNTTPRTINRTTYFNPCAPLTDLPECGDDNRYCEIESIEINGTWETTAIRWIGSESQGMQEQVVVPEDGNLIVTYVGAMWGDHVQFSRVHFHCSNETSIEPNGEYVGVVVSTPHVCDLKEDPPSWDEGGLHVWGTIGRVCVVLVIILIVYIAIALYSFSRDRPLGPLTGEIAGAIRELPHLVSDLVSAIYERVTGRGTGRNTI